MGFDVRDFIFFFFFARAKAEYICIRGYQEHF